MYYVTNSYFWALAEKNRKISVRREAADFPGLVEKDFGLADGAISAKADPLQPPLELSICLTDSQDTAWMNAQAGSVVMWEALVGAYYLLHPNVPHADWNVWPSELVEEWKLKHRVVPILLTIKVPPQEPMNWKLGHVQGIPNYAFFESIPLEWIVAAQGLP
jgi:hypothetical protein